MQSEGTVHSVERKVLIVEDNPWNMKLFERSSRGAWLHSSAGNGRARGVTSCSTAQAGPDPDGYSVT